ncbi:uncharacterized protein MEPE_00955 [Melanopsichium pennsylvanicum]|uniref:Uncharacterized protein n=2 Tax=Melanopsichium pennsylvanicum TaxID=63383 RepID=A0AAJ4XH13_9BASI|nr:hypothetical protein BN887_00862 [Melanopsichium pennsylvanicum 4]SNX82249.1 uncharacterized protein MEPE_00955 [Melanopsichium pennsylvanicum]
MKLTSSFAALSSAVVIALCVGQAQADTVTTPLGLTQVDDKGVPITPLTYLNLAPASQDLSDAAKKITTPPPMIHQKRLLPSGGDHLEPVVEQFTSNGISIKRELGDSLIPSLPILGALDNEGDHTNANPPKAPTNKRLLDSLKSLDLPDGSEFMPANHQELGQRTVHPLNRRDGDSPLDVNFFGKNLPDLLPKMSAGKRESSGLNILGEDIPLNAIKLPGVRRQDAEQAPVKPLDLGLETGNKQDLDSAKSLLGGLLPIKRDDVKPVDLGLKTGNEQDMDRANDFLGGLLGGVSEQKRDTISPDNVDLGSVKKLGEGLASDAAKDAVPLALAPVKQTASPAVEVIKTANGLCTSFGCEQMVQGAVDGVKSEVPVPLPAARALGDKEFLTNGLLNNKGQVDGLPVKRAQDPVVDTILETSDGARDLILDVKTKADDAAGEFVKNMYSKHGEVQTKRALTLPGYTLLPGSGPKAKAAAKELVDFIGLPLPGTKRMEKVKRK